MLSLRENEAFFELLKSGLWEKSIQNYDCFPLTANEWKSIYMHAIRHTVEGVLFDAVQKLESIYLPSKELLKVWLVRVEKIAQRNDCMDEVIKQQNHFFKKHYLNPILLKGRAVASIYPNSKRRSCGDIDWYFEDHREYKKCIEILDKKKVNIQYCAGYSVNYQWEGFDTDQHLKQFDVSNPFLKRYLRTLEKENAHLEQKLIIDEAHIRLSSPALQSIQVNIHILKHLLSFGIGIRQLCDAARIYYVYADKMNGVWLKKTYRKLGVLNWINALHRILVEYIGLHRDKLPFEIVDSNPVTSVMEDIWQSGNFGFQTGYSHDLMNKKEFDRGVSTIDILKRVFHYMPYAPMEAISFPFVHLYSKWFT